MRSQIKGRFYPTTELEIECYLCAELAPAHAARFELLLAEDAALAAYVAERRAAQRDFAARQRWDRARDRTAAVAARSVPRSNPWSRAALTAAAALLLVLAARPLVELDTSRATTTPQALRPPETVRVKGTGLQTELYVKRGERVFLHEAGTRLQAGDRLRLAVEVAEAGYLTVLARDERGEISVYYDAVRTTPGRFVAPDSLRLDAAQAGEDWLVLVATAARPWHEYADAWRSGHEPELPHAWLRLERGQP